MTVTPSVHQQRLASPPGAESPRALVTGGAGFVGSHLCDRLLELGWQVTCVDDLSSGSVDNLRLALRNPRFHLVVADVSDGLPLLPVPDVVWHLASPASPKDYLERPLACLRAGAFGTWHVLELVRQVRARFVLASTSEVYGDPLEHPQRETYWGNVNPIGPRSVYDEAKRYAEAVTAQFRRGGVDTAIVRIFNTYGPRMRVGDGRVVPTFIAQALSGEPLTVCGDGMQTRSLCFVADLVEGLIAMGRHDHPGPVNLGGTEELTVAEIAELVQLVVGSRSPVRQVDRLADDPSVRRPDTTLARDLLGWQPRWKLADGLRLTAEDVVLSRSAGARGWRDDDATLPPTAMPPQPAG
jgi:dTDP-glucose 4,6-dehydratase